MEFAHISQNLSKKSIERPFFFFNFPQKGIKALLGQKTKYSKAHLKSYAELLSQHGVRVKACSRACVPEDGAACSDEAYTGFLSDYRDLIEPVSSLLCGIREFRWKFTDFEAFPLILETSSNDALFRYISQLTAQK